jgi:general secretion pathway protein J
VSESGRSAGFTLVELLVATTLLALLSAALFGGLRFGARAWESGSERIERSSEIEAVQELLRRTLLEAREGGGAASDSLAGASDALNFFAPLPRHAGTGGIGRYRLAVDGDGRMVLGWEPSRPGVKLEGPPAGEPIPILGNVGGISIAYFGSAQPKQATAWRDRWAGRVLPLLIRIEIDFKEGDPRRWPELVIAPRLARPPKG